MEDLLATEEKEEEEGMVDLPATEEKEEEVMVTTAQATVAPATAITPMATGAPTITKDTVEIRTEALCTEVVGTIKEGATVVLVMTQMETQGMDQVLTLTDITVVRCIVHPDLVAMIETGRPLWQEVLITHVLLMGPALP